MRPSALIAHAKKHVWQEPKQDYQYNIGLARLTKNGGVIHSQNVLWHKVYTPKDGERKWYHIYQIGQLPERLFDIKLIHNQWVRVSDLSQHQALLVDMYLVSGAMIPRHKVWLMQDLTRNFLVAIEHDRKMDYGVDVKIDDYSGVQINKRISLDTDNVIARFYVNAHFSNYSFRDQAINPLNPVQVHYATITDDVSFKRFLYDCDALVSRFQGQGLGIFYHDGFVITRPTLYDKRYEGATLGFMWDESFKHEQFFDLSQTPAFTSKLDQGRKKWLLFTDTAYDIIDFYDDVDFYICRRDQQGFKGVMISRVKDYAFRMVTHSAYAVDAELVEYYVKTHDFLGDITKCSIYIMVRQGGKLRGLINQKNRIEELYKLGNRDAVIEAMVNTNALVPEWQAAELENSHYTALMRADDYQINLALAQDAYGYSALTHVICPPIHNVKQIGNKQQVETPPGLHVLDNATGSAKRCVFCYDSHGQLMGYFNDASSDIYLDIPPTITGSTTAEVFNAFIDDDSGTYINMDVVDNDLEQYGFRCYAAIQIGDRIEDQWEDITHQTEFYTYTPGDNMSDAKLEWQWSRLQAAGLCPAVKTQGRVHMYTRVFDRSQDRDGYVNLTVQARQKIAGNNVVRVQHIAPAQVTVFANGMTLIEGIDYYVHWPNVVVVNKAVNNQASVELIVRSYGCGQAVAGGVSVPYKPREVGFIKGGRLSVNDRYDIHNDKSIKIVVAGSFKKRSEVNFSEDNLGALGTNGLPYAIEDYILPIENFTVNKRTNEFYEEVVGIEDRVSDYLDLWLPEPDWGLATIENERWEVVSPLLCAMCYAIENGYAIDENTSENFDNIEAEHWMKPWAWLLKFDPAYLKVDTRYVHISPHPFDHLIEMTQKQYELLQTIIKLYLNGLVDLSAFVRIKQEK